MDVKGLRTTYLIICFEKIMQDHLVDGRSEAEISSGQILTDGLQPEREEIKGKRLFQTK